MTTHAPLPGLDRRKLLVGALAASALAGLPGASAQAQTGPAKAAEELMKSILGGAKPTEGKLLFDISEIAENGNTVPFTVSVESPMTDKDYVKAIHVISTANPQPNVVTFRFSTLSGTAKASSRMRLADTQEVISLAELSDGKFLMSKRTVKVTVGGCGG
jgi:sulfur-oxidizing protein SoxY